MLAPFLSAKEVPIEIIIFDDGSNDGTEDAVTSLLEYYNHDRAYYYNSEIKRTHGISFTEALQHGNAPWFAIIDKPVRPNFVKLFKLLDEIEDINAEPVISRIPSPEIISSLINLKVPASANFIFNKGIIPPSDLFLNPFLEGGHGCELYLRMADLPDGALSHDAFAPEDRSILIPVNRNDAQVITFHGKLKNKQTSKGKAAKTQSEKPALDDAQVQTVLERIAFLRSEGHFAEALDLTNQILESNPDHVKAEEIKIFLLERLNRYVEASEMKFLRKRRMVHTQREIEEIKEDVLVSRPVLPDKPPLPEIELTKGPVHEERDDFRYSIIIPVTGVTQAFLETTLISVSLYCDPARTELIIIDNACLDDTYSYLDQLREKNFYNIKVIKNLRNAGFARSVNQGLDKARGEFLCVMHSDVVLESKALDALATILEKNKEIGLIGPVTDNTMNPEQAKEAGSDSTAWEQANYLDSFMLMFHKADALRFDDRFRQAWFEDVDLCWQVKQSGKMVAVATGVQVSHYFGATTDSMGLSYDSLTYQANQDRFNKKWNIAMPLPELPEEMDAVQELMQIGEAINVYYPEEQMAVRAKELLTSEVRTEILKSELDQRSLGNLIRVMMVLDQRDVMRQLEEKLSAPADPLLISELTHFYFSKNIYSRCTKYLDFNGGDGSLSQRLYRLRIAWGEKNLDLVSSLLQELIAAAPGHPELNKIAGDVHDFDGNKDEAEEFYTLAGQLDPFRFPWPKEEGNGDQEG